MKELILLGGGGHALSVADSILQDREYRIVGYTDPAEDTACPFEYLGTDEVLQEYYEKGVKYAFICVGFMGGSSVRDSLYQKLKAIGYEIPVVTDPSAILAEECRIGEGTFIGKGAIVNTHADIGKMSIINTGALIEHSCRIGDYTHIAVGAMLCGDVKIGSNTLIGAGTTVKQGVRIGNDCVIGMGSTVLCDVRDNSKRVGLIKE